MAETVATIDFDESWGKVLQMYLESQSADDYAIFDRNGRLIPLLEMGNKFIPKPEDFPLTVARKAGLCLFALSSFTSDTVMWSYASCAGSLPPASSHVTPAQKTSPL